METPVVLGMREYFSESSFRTSCLSQEEMIQRAYPKYNQKKDWVLWIMLEFYHDKKIDHIECNVEIKKKDGSCLDIPYMVKQPYPNKYIYQVCRKTEMNDAKNCFAIPVVFKTLEEMQEIVNVSAKWSFFVKCGMAEKNRNLALQFISTEVDYLVSFQKNVACENAHVFTLHSKAISLLTEYGKYTEEAMELYLAKFDFVAYSEAVIRLNKGKISEIEVDNTEYYKVTGYSDYNVGKKMYMHEAHMKNLEKKTDMIVSMGKTVAISNAVQYYPMFCTKKVLLTATEIASDILAEPEWGFARIF